MASGSSSTRDRSTWRSGNRIRLHLAGPRPGHDGPAGRQRPAFTQRRDHRPVGDRSPLPDRRPTSTYPLCSGHRGGRRPFGRPGIDAKAARAVLRVLKQLLQNADFSEVTSANDVLGAVPIRVNTLESRAFLSPAVSLQDPIIGKTLDGTVVLWNEAAKKLYGILTAAEMLGQNVSVLIPPDRTRRAPLPSRSDSSPGDAVHATSTRNGCGRTGRRSMWRSPFRQLSVLTDWYWVHQRLLHDLTLYNQQILDLRPRGSECRRGDQHTRDASVIGSRRIRICRHRVSPDEPERHAGLLRRINHRGIAGSHRGRCHSRDLGAG